MPRQGTPHSQVARVPGKYLRGHCFKASFFFLFPTVVTHDKSIFNLSQGFYFSKSCPIPTNFESSGRDALSFRGSKSLKLPIQNHPWGTLSGSGKMTVGGRNLSCRKCIFHDLEKKILVKRASPY